MSIAWAFGTFLYPILVHQTKYHTLQCRSELFVKIIFCKAMMICILSGFFRDISQSNHLHLSRQQVSISAGQTPLHAHRVHVEYARHKIQHFRNQCRTRSFGTQMSGGRRLLRMTPRDRLDSCALQIVAGVLQQAWSSQLASSWLKRSATRSPTSCQ